MFDPSPLRVSKVQVVEGVNNLFDAWSDLNNAMAGIEEVIQDAGAFDPYLEQCLMIALGEHDQMKDRMDTISYRMDQLKQKGVI